MTGIQLVAICFAAGMVFLTHTAYRRSEVRRSEYSIWLAVWVALVLISIFPGQLRAVIAPLQVARLLDVITVGGLFFLAAVVFALNRTVRRLENQLNKLVGTLALSEAGTEADKLA